jgi:hypothetical protein
MPTHIENCLEIAIEEQCQIWGSGIGIPYLANLVTKILKKLDWNLKTFKDQLDCEYERCE